MMDTEYLCPLCKSILTRDRFLEITGKWDDQQKSITDAEKQLKKAEKEKAELEKKYKQDARKLEKEAKLKGMEEGAKKEKAERTKMVELLQKNAQDQAKKEKIIQSLQKQLAEGKTPQTAGFDFEKEVCEQLQSHFPDDDIQPTGKKGDNIQYVKHGDEIIGSILYECKKTNTYSNAFIKEVKRHMEDAKADYAVLITHAFKDGKTGIFIEEDVIVINPISVLDIAYLLRSAIIQMHQLKKTGEEADRIGKDILKYMQSGDFRANMLTAMNKAEEAYTLMLKEVNEHKRNWNERYKIYTVIHSNVQSVRMEIGKIITGKEIPIEEFKRLPELPQ